MSFQNRSTLLCRANTTSVPIYAGTLVCSGGGAGSDVPGVEAWQTVYPRSFALGISLTDVPPSSTNQPCSIVTNDGEIVLALCEAGTYLTGLTELVPSSSNNGRLAVSAALSIGNDASFATALYTGTLAAAALIPVLIRKRGGVYADLPILSQLTTQVIVPPWIAVSYQNSWVDFGASATSRYYKDALGEVHLEVKCKTGTIATAAFTMPVGYRPGQNASVSGLTAAGALACADLLTTGVLTPTVGASAGVFYRFTYPAEG